MRDLVEALIILLKYGNPYSPTSCDHDVIWVHISPTDVSADDLARLGELGFTADLDNDNFRSYRFGSA